MKKAGILWIMIIWVLAGCSSLFNSHPADAQKALPRKLTAEEKQLIASAQPFSYELFRTTVQFDDTARNLFISPLSVSMALGMTMNGAAGETKAAMKEALYLQEMDMPDINESYASLTKLLTGADPGVNMKLANSIWIRDEFQVEADFKKRAEKFFKARIASLDFSDPSATDKINQWVRNHTEQLIDQIIEGRIPDEIVMYLINAIYFKGNWQYRFDPEQTRERSFVLEDGTSTETKMMSQQNNLAAYVSDEVQILDLPYGNNLFTMTLMMPGNDQQPIETFIRKKLTAPNVDQWLSKMSVAPTRVLLPKFEMEYEVTMNDILKMMGMGVAFSSGANFTNINPGGKLYIDEVKHKSFIKIDEKGTEAAAVTSVGIALTSVGPANMRSLQFDRPFVFLIRERTSGTILFMGMMKNPGI